MQNLEELSRDIIIEIDHLRYETGEEKMLQSELSINISRLLRDVESYEDNIAALRLAVAPALEEKYYSDEVFKKVTTDVINAICNLNYDDRQKLIDKLELAININKFLESQPAYYNNIRTLVELDRNKARKM